MTIQEEMKITAESVNKYLFSFMSGDPKILYNASYHLIKSGGKRMRPFLTLKSCELFGGSEKIVLPVAAAVELIHNFTLVHDDIMDDDNLRHGVPTVHIKYNLPTAILAGDVLFAASFQSVSKKFKDLGISSDKAIKMVEILADSSVTVCEGQTKDIMMALDHEFHSSSDYFQMIEKKTAALFETSCRLGSISGGADQKDEESLATFGRYFGIAFQMVDDVLGVVGEHKVTGKPVGGDILQGKKTYIISLALETVEESDRQKILNIFGKKFTSQADVKTAIDILSSSGVADVVRKKARSYAKMALENLSSFPDNSAKKSLFQMTDFMISRNL